MNPFLLRFEQFELENKTETPKPGTEDAEEDDFGIYGTTNGLGEPQPRHATDERTPGNER